MTWETLSEGEEGDGECATGPREGSLGDDPLVSGPLASGAVAEEEGRSGVKFPTSDVVGEISVEDMWRNLLLPPRLVSFPDPSPFN